MFGRRFFGGAFFGQRYFAEAGGVPPEFIEAPRFAIAAAELRLVQPNEPARVVYVTAEGRSV